MTKAMAMKSKHPVLSQYMVYLTVYRQRKHHPHPCPANFAVTKKVRAQNLLYLKYMRVARFLLIVKLACLFKIALQSHPLSGWRRRGEGPGVAV
jgi:hypothetical protein